MNAKERSKILVSRFRKGSLPYDMEQWACYAIMNAEKQARAEALVAVSKHRPDMDEGLCACGWESKGETWAEHILSLQPAASDLEGLLRKSEIRGAMDELALIETERGHRGWFAFDLYGQTGARLKSLKDELAELEKARATVMEKS